MAQREMVEEPQGQGGFDGEIRVPPLPTPTAAPAGRPGSDRFRGQPHRHIAAANGVVARIVTGPHSAAAGPAAGAALGSFLSREAVAWPRLLFRTLREEGQERLPIGRQARGRFRIRRLVLRDEGVEVFLGLLARLRRQDVVQRSLGRGLETFRGYCQVEADGHF